MLPLHQAIEHENIIAVAELIANGANVNERDPSLGMATPLHIAVDIECEISCRKNDAGDHLSIPIATYSELLIHNGANPMEKDARGKTAKDWAQIRNHQNAIALFESL